jgi:hypothetical protein
VVKKSNQLTRKRRVVPRRNYCKVMRCTGWSKFAGKVQLPVLEVIFQLFECTKRCTTIGFLETVL